MPHFLKKIHRHTIRLDNRREILGGSVRIAFRFSPDTLMLL
jgi:hypothetical protein